jgi:4'-phosphopantetheinyl transferase
MENVSREHLERSIVVWITRVSQAPESLDFLDPLLDDHDRERAARFRFAEDRARFVLGRSLVRKALGLYLGQEPETIKLSYADRGRPVFAEDETVHFSISHTHDIVAVALAANARVGLDFEFVKPAVDLAELAERILGEEDLRKFQALPRAEALTVFFRAWTRKEAYLKACSEGIADGLRQVSVSFGAEDISPLIDSRDETGSRKWRLHNLTGAKDYMGALACDDPGRHVDCLDVQLKKDEESTDIKLTSIAQDRR